MVMVYAYRSQRSPSYGMGIVALQTQGADDIVEPRVRGLDKAATPASAILLLIEPDEAELSWRASSCSRVNGRV